MTARINADDAGRGLGQLVVALLDIVRQLVERQAVRRVDAGDLTAEQVERLGQALLALEERFAELREAFADDDGSPPGVDDFLAGIHTTEGMRRYDRGSAGNQPRTAPEQSR